MRGRAARGRATVEPWHPVSAGVGEREVGGRWQLRGAVLHVWSHDGRASTQLGGMPAATLAKLLLKEIANRLEG